MLSYRPLDRLCITSAEEFLLGDSIVSVSATRFYPWVLLPHLCTSSRTRIHSNLLVVAAKKVHTPLNTGIGYPSLENSLSF